MKKDLLLIKPLSAKNLQCTPPLGLGCIATSVKRAGFSVRIIDCNTRKIPPAKLPYMVDLFAYRAIGIQSFDMDLPDVKKYLSVIKRIVPEVITIVGGPAPSASPKFVFQYLENVDFLVVGEGEYTARDLLQNLDESKKYRSVLDKVANLVWREEEHFHFTPHEYIMNLDDVGYPDWDELNPSIYANAVHGFFYKRLPLLPIMISRGCPFKCAFCGSREITGYKIRRRSPDKVVDELAYLKEKYGIAEFQIIDDNFSFPPTEAMKFANLLIERNLNLSWTCPNGLRVETLNRKLLEAMKSSGCYEVAVGIESGDINILKSMKKHLHPDIVKEKVHLIHSVGITVIGFVMVGYPGETEETIRRTMNYILKSPVVRISLTRFVPMPGTPVAKMLVKEGKLKEEDLDPTKLHYDDFTYIPVGLSESRLRYLYRLFFFRFLLRPRIIFHNLKSIRSITHAIVVFKKILYFIS